jgi:hypothetical protein
VTLLHKEATQGERPQHQQPTSGSEVPGLHSHIVEKATMLAVAHHVISDDSAK